MCPTSKSAGIENKQQILVKAHLNADYCQVSFVFVIGLFLHGLNTEPPQIIGFTVFSPVFGYYHLFPVFPRK